jgi:hypothetical protein
MMTRVKCAAVLAAALAVLGLALGPSAADEGKGPSVKEIMGKAHKGGNSLLVGVFKGVQAPSPDWGGVQAKTKELVKLGTSLGKAEPPQGDKDSWQRLTGTYLNNAKSLDTAAEEMNKPGAQAALQKLRGSCKGCHDVHKG